MRVSLKLGTPFRGVPHNEDYSIMGPILGLPLFVESTKSRGGMGLYVFISSSLK